MEAPAFQEMIISTAASAENIAMVQIVKNAIQVSRFKEKLADFKTIKLYRI